MATARSSGMNRRLKEDPELRRSSANWTVCMAPTISRLWKSCKLDSLRHFGGGLQFHPAYSFNLVVMNFVLLLFGGGYRHFWQEAELPCHVDVIAGCPMFDDQAVFHPEYVDVFRIEALAGRRYARQQSFVDERVLANPLMSSTNHTTRHDPIPLRHDVERRHFHIRECNQYVLKYGADHITVDRDAVIVYLVGEKFALSYESFLLDGLEHLPNGNFILFSRVHYSFNFSAISVQFRSKNHSI
jgi:hypothetical protein